MNAPLDQAAFAASIRAATLIATQRRGLAVAFANAPDAWTREEVRQCQHKVEGWVKSIALKAMFAAENAIVALGPNMHGPRIDAAIAGGVRRGVATGMHLTAGGRNVR